MQDISRRDFMAGVSGLGLLGLIGWPGMTLAAANTPKRLMLVILRGAMDGLGAVPPIGDRSYHAARGALAMPDSGLLPLDGHFAMNAALKPLHAMYQSKELVVLHATATPYRDRSHFDAQDLLENGTLKPHQVSTGWLGRTIQALGGTTQGLAMGSTIPLVLQGTTHVQSWAPAVLPQADQDFMARVARMYEHDPLLSAAIAQEAAMGSPDIAKLAQGKRAFVDMMKVAAGFMKKDNGARIGSIDIGGWDTHSGQGTTDGRLAQALQLLGEGVAAFKTEMGPVWKDTAVLMLTEFGRTVAANGSGGSDHGTGSAAFMAGGSVQGGRVLGDWPGLAQNNLYEGRDLYPANDMRSLIKAMLQQHLAVPADIVERDIFPQSSGVRAIPALFA